MTSQLIEFRYVDPRHSRSLVSLETTGEFRRATQDHAVFRTCKSSRARAERWRADHTYALRIRNVSPPTPISGSSPIDFDYDPVQDTIYLSGLYELLGFWRPTTQISQDYIENYRLRLAKVRTLALGGDVLKRAYYIHRHETLGQEAGCTDVKMESCFGRGFASLSRLIMFRFPGLENLIIIIPPVNERDALKSRRSPKSWYGSQHYEYVFHKKPNYVRAGC